MGNKHVVSLSDDKFKKLIRVGKTFGLASYKVVDD